MAAAYMHACRLTCPLASCAYRQQHWAAEVVGTPVFTHVAVAHKVFAADLRHICGRVWPAADGETIKPAVLTCLWTTEGAELGLPHVHGAVSCGIWPSCSKACKHCTLQTSSVWLQPNMWHHHACIKLIFSQVWPCTGQLLHGVSEQQVGRQQQQPAPACRLQQGPAHPFLPRRHPAQVAPSPLLPAWHRL